ncbi:MAG: hypothetical protein HOA00_10725, partial [Rhodospirillaceae bacterium]|nr:hypothetical protein [Rhodospirillaceae bacterium]
DPCGRTVTVVGRSLVVGRPLSAMLTASLPGGNATVTTCHSRSQNLAEHTRQADIVVMAVGRRHMLTPDMVKPGAIVIDVGTHPVERDGKWTLDGDVIRRQEGDNFPPIIPQPSIEYASMFSWASEVFDPDLDRASGVSSGWNIMAGSRPPYVELGVPPGNVNWHFDAVKLDDTEQLDDDYLALARAHSDRFDISPELDEGPSFFERILKLRGINP